MNSVKVIKTCLNIARSLLLLIAGISLYLIFCKYQALSNYLSLINSGKAFHFFTYEVMKGIKIVLVFIVLFCCILFYLTEKFLPRIKDWLNSLVASSVELLNRIKKITRRFFRYNNTYLTFFFVITFCMVYLRIIEINRSLHHDEAKSILFYISKSWYQVFSNYGVPNNHILHSAFARFFYLVFGDQVWIYRLPAFIAGLLLPITAYILIMRYTDNYIALLFYSLVVFSSPLINYSVNARGYTMISLFFVLILLTIEYISVAKLKSIGYVLLALLGSLGLFTTTPMAIFILISYTWFVFKVKDDTNLKQLSKIFYTGSITIILTFIFYTPSILRCGLGAIVDNEYLKSFSLYGFMMELPSYMQDIVVFFTAGCSKFLKFLLITFMCVGIFVAFRTYKLLFNFVIVAFLVFLSFILFKRFLPPERTTIPFIFIFYTLIAIALNRVLMFVTSRFKMSFLSSRPYYFLLVGIIIFNAIHSLRTGSLIEVDENQTSVFLPEVTKRLSLSVSKDDLVMVASPLAAASMYYLKRREISENQFFWYSEGKAIDVLKQKDKVYIITTKSDGLVFYLKGLGPSFIMRVSPEIFFETGDLSVYTLRTKSL